jgi:signal peptidase
MKAVRMTGSALLWVLAVIGVLSGALWLAHAAGWVQPLVVVSGSMQPDIRKGDLLLALPVAAEELEVGEVATLPGPMGGTLVTHRIVSVQTDGGNRVIEMAGDANGVTDPTPYVVAAASRVWQPAVTIPGAGDVVLALARPGVAIPLAVAVLALIALSLLPSHPRPSRPVPVGAEGEVP